MLCFYFQQKNRVDFIMGAIIRKNEFTLGENNIWSVKAESITENKLFTLWNHKYQTSCKFYILPTLINDGMNDIVFWVILNNLVFKGYTFQKNFNRNVCTQRILNKWNERWLTVSDGFQVGNSLVSPVHWKWITIYTWVIEQLIAQT